MVILTLFIIEYVFVGGKKPSMKATLNAKLDNLINLYFIASSLLCLLIYILFETYLFNIFFFSGLFKLSSFFPICSLISKSYNPPTISI